MKNCANVVLFACAIASTAWVVPEVAGKSPALAAQSSTASSPPGKDAGSAEREKRIKSIVKSTLKSFSTASLSAEQQQQAESVFGKAAKTFVAKRTEALITDSLEKKVAACLKEARGSTVKERTSAAYTCAGLTDEQIKVFESTQRALDKAKRDFQKTLTDTQIAALPKAAEKASKGSKP